MLLKIAVKKSFTYYSKVKKMSIDSGQNYMLR